MLRRFHPPIPLGHATWLRRTAVVFAVTSLVAGQGCGRTAPRGTAIQPAIAPGQGWKPRDADSDFVGSAACAECHAEIAEIYRGHPMSKSVTRVTDPEILEDYEHLTKFSPLPKREYRVQRDGDQVTHHEVGLAANGKVEYDQGVPVSFAIGSGKRGRSYVIDRGGQLFLSPISWYSKDRRWDLSPEYQPENHPRFERPANDRCLLCHAGRVNYQDRPSTELTQRYGSQVFAEAMIGCERCHGPGKRHVETHRAAGRRDGTPTGKGDDTIVQPDRLSDSRRDAVCNQCHLVGEAQFLRYGRRNGDFRPGDRVGEIWTIFVGGTGVTDNLSTRAVSHVEQMQASRCYQATSQSTARRLGCTSCHDPHDVPEDENRVAFFDGRCAACHADRGCSLPEDQRKAEPAGGSCIACHMPRLTAYDVPHTTQTDHRVPRLGRPSTAAERPPASEKSANGVAADTFDDPSQWTIFDHQTVALAPWEIDRAWGLLLAHGAEKNRDADLARQAEAKLRPVRALIPDDVDVLDASAVCLHLLGRRDEAAKLWDDALGIEPDRQSVLHSLVLFWQSQGQPTRAHTYLERLLKVNPWQAEYHGRNSMLLARLGRLDDAVAAAERARELNPSLATANSWLAELYRRQGREEDAARLEGSGKPASR